MPTHTSQSCMFAAFQAAAACACWHWLPQKSLSETVSSRVSTSGHCQIGFKHSFYAVCDPFIPSRIAECAGVLRSYCHRVQG
jgi:hypothetical protein